MRALTRLSSPAADPAFMTCYCVFAGEVDFRTHEISNWENRSQTLHDPVNWHPNTGLRTLEEALPDCGSEDIYFFISKLSLIWTMFIISIPLTGISESSLLHVGNLMTLHMKPSPQGSRRIGSTTLFPFLIICMAQSNRVLPYSPH